jgi:hypothetical protein
MNTIRRFATAVLVLVLLTAHRSPLTAVLAADPAPAAVARKALDEAGNVSFETKSLADVAAYFKSRTGVEVRFDPGALAAAGIDPAATPFSVKLRGVKYGDALRAVFAPYDLRCGVVGGAVVVSTDEGLTRRQMRQRVSLDPKGASLQAVLAALAEQTGANVVLDPRAKGKAAEAAVELRLDDVPLEAAVRLAAEVAGFRAVRLHNVLFVTTDERAEKLKSDLEEKDGKP